MWQTQAHRRWNMQSHSRRNKRVTHGNSCPRRHQSVSEELWGEPRTYPARIVSSKSINVRSSETAMGALAVQCEKCWLKRPICGQTYLHHFFFAHGAVFDGTEHNNYFRPGCAGTQLRVFWRSDLSSAFGLFFVSSLARFY